MHFWKIEKIRNLGNFGYFIVHGVIMMWRPCGGDVEFHGDISYHGGN
jgi:hypothetical protein